MNHKEAVTIPKGCVLAFRVRQLMVNGKDEWGEQRPACSPLEIKVTCILVLSCRNVRGGGGSILYCPLLEMSKGCSREGGEGVPSSEFQVSLGTGESVGSDTKTKPASDHRRPREETDPADTSTGFQGRKCYHRRGENLQVPAVRVG